MKTLKIIIVVCIWASFASNNIMAQNAVVKETAIDFPIECQFMPCIDEYISGLVTVEFKYMENKWTAHIIKGTLQSYIDESCTIQSTNVYESSQTISFHGDNIENHLVCRLNGKLMFTVQYVFRVDEKTGEVHLDRETWNCHN
jgi:hypothetical protein